MSTHTDRRAELGYSIREAEKVVHQLDNEREILAMDAENAHPTTAALYQHAQHNLYHAQLHVARAQIALEAAHAAEQNRNARRAS